MIKQFITQAGSVLNVNTNDVVAVEATKSGTIMYLKGIGAFFMLADNAVDVVAEIGWTSKRGSPIKPPSADLI